MKRVVVVLLLWVSSLALAMTYMAIGQGLDAVLSDLPAPQWLWAVGTAVVSGVCAFAVSLMGGFELADLEPQLRRGLVSQVFMLGPSQRTRERSGRIVNSATDGVERNATYRATFIAPMIASLATPVLVVLIVGVFIDWVSAGFLAIVIPLVPLSVGLFQMAFRPVSKRYRASSRKLAAQELDAIQGLGALSLMNAGKRMGRVLADEAENVRFNVMRYLAGNQVTLLVIDSVFSLGMITGAAALGLVRVEAGAISIGQGLALVLLSSIMLDPLDRIGQFFYIGMGGIAAGREIKAFNAQVPTACDAPGVTEPQSVPAPGTLSIQGVDFAYNEDVPVLVNADLSVQAGEHIVLAGPSGAGKSTLLALLQGHVQPASGKVLIEGIDVACAPLAWVRSRAGVVEQTTYLFSGTLRDNLLIAAPDATDEDLIAALNAAHLQDLLKRLPEGLDTQVGSRGLALSGGEAQRVAIARALLKDAPILLLDEPTAHVDLTSEREILAALSQASVGKTTVTVSHRQATIEDASRRVDLVEGKIQ
ncbi:ABC transporter ATP-binding protein/permease [Schaalia vaccimaxillae]|uniref:ABC transporter ATP-binding protein/permease n=1 Tax=Schaalia vaccimaxillae TaxID=183916 RepID=UPI0003B3BFD5|nr:ABC transporter ATP-binding protein [Schaalia vaccimaxillae]